MSDTKTVPVDVYCVCCGSSDQRFDERGRCDSCGWNNRRELEKAREKQTTPG
jgi:hypothetical protein